MNESEREHRLEIIKKYYLSDKKKKAEIAEILVISFGKLGLFLKENGLKKPIKYKPHMNRDWVYQKYVVERWTGREIAKFCEVSWPSVYKWLRKFNIEVRLHKDSMHGGDRYICKKWNSEIEEFLTGELLGDGCLVSNCAYTAYYMHSTSKRNYLVWLEKIFNLSGIEKVGRIREYKGYRSPDNVFYSMTTRTYKEFKTLYEKFYPNGKKIVPKDLILTPLVVRQWYIGDGSISKRENAASIATNGFTENDVDFLIEKLIQLGISASKCKSRSGHTLYVPVKSAKVFFDFIGKCPDELENVYGYKWPR